VAAQAGGEDGSSEVHISYQKAIHVSFKVIASPAFKKAHVACDMQSDQV
jgi:hypothetical protein